METKEKTFEELTQLLSDWIQAHVDAYSIFFEVGRLGDDSWFASLNVTRKGESEPFLFFYGEGDLEEVLRTILDDLGGGA